MTNQVETVEARLKQVPDDSPNVGGEWVIRSVPSWIFKPRKVPGCSSNIFDLLSTHCDPGHHCVNYERVK